MGQTDFDQQGTSVASHIAHILGTDLFARLAEQDGREYAVEKRPEQPLGVVVDVNKESGNAGQQFGQNRRIARLVGQTSFQQFRAGWSFFGPAGH